MQHRKCFLLVGLLLGIPFKAHCTTQGEYQTWGIVTAVGGTLTGIGAIAEFSIAGKNQGTDEGSKALTSGLIWLGVTGGLLYASMYCFDHASKHYAAFLNIDRGAVALGLPALSYELEQRCGLAQLLEVRI